MFQRIALGVVLFASLNSAFAQVAGGLKGTVLDASGAGIPGAKVSLLLPNGKAAILTTQGRGDGSFDFQTVRSDTYNLTVELEGFAKASVNGVMIEPVRQTELAPLPAEWKSSAGSEVQLQAGLVRTPNYLRRSTQESWYRSRRLS